MLMSYRTWVLRFVVIMLSVESMIAVGNYWFDPLWCFGSVNSSNATAIVIDQRQQKTNLVAFGPCGYDTLIIGSSRVEPLDARDFAGLTAFNYSLPALFPDEYQEYIDFFRKKNGNSLRKIYLGLDFFGTIEKKPVVNRLPRSYFDEVEAKSSRLNSLLGSDPLIKFVKGHFEKDFYIRYDRRANTLIPRDLTEAERQLFIMKRLSVFEKNFYADNAYSYNQRYRAQLANIAERNRDLDLHVFTTTVSKPLFELMVRQGRYPDYERWLRDAVSVFGTVINFMTVNSVTSDMSSYYDADHLYPFAARYVSRRLCGLDGMNMPTDFGDVVTRETVESYLSNMRRRVADLPGGLESLQQIHMKETLLK